jgi:hypothetical protein
VVLDRLTIIAMDGESVLEFSYEPSHVLLRADEDAPRLRAPFTAIAALLKRKAPNGFGRCSMDVSTPGSWREPTAPPPRAPTAPAIAAARGPGLLARWWRRMPFARRHAARR